MLDKQKKRIMRHRRARAKIFGTTGRPRLSVFRSNKFLRAQLINDKEGKTLLQMTDTGKGAKAKKTKTESARDLGKNMAIEARKKKIKKAVFDKGGYAYHGRIKSFAEGAREGGLEF